MNLHLEPHFLQEVSDELKRFNREISFRREEENEIKAEAEARALAKKKAAANKKKWRKQFGLCPLFYT